MTRIRDMLPGAALALAIAIAAHWLAGWIGTTLLSLPRSPISGITVAIVLGLALANLTTMPASIQCGLKFALTTLLRLGIVLLGLRLSIAEIGEIGLRSIPIILAAITTALLVAALVTRWLALPSRLAALIAVGTSICGATAIVATAPTIGAREAETSYAVACIALFGLSAMLAYPFVAHWLFDGDGMRGGLFLGTAVHDTAQVLGAGMVYREYYGDAHALDVATVTKMVRNLSMIAIIPIMAIAFSASNAVQGAATRPRWHQLVPAFVIGFAAMSIIRTVGDRGDHAFGLLTAGAWHAGLAAAGSVADLLLGTAMAAVGLSTRFAMLRSIGFRPLFAALLCALAVGGVAAGTIRALY